jgi:uridine monophosphate synthetase|tara:strand:- start:46 stop:1212 length:1167 start_codon:yes stop_codon:yes gene_type:complete
MLLETLYEKKIIQQGNFKLKSGEISNIYIDLRQVISYPEIHKEICNQISKKINSDINLICGTPYGAISYASYISISNNLPMIFLRKEKKSHGTQKMIEGIYSKNSKVFLIEDVTTTGGSVRDAAECLEKHGLIVSQIITIISRNCNKNIFYKNINIDYLYHLDDLQIVKKNTLKEIINIKKTNICLAADINNMSELFKLIHEVGNNICILKIHSDIIYDFFTNYKENCLQLDRLKKIYNFRIWEDRKLADIGNIMARQIELISEWADIVSVHPISGGKSLNCINGIDIIIIIEMSSQGHLMNSLYQKEAVKIAENNENVIGIVSQNKVSDKLLHIVPGISLSKNSDGLGQIYNPPISKSFADILVIGRGIYLSDDPNMEIQKYKNYSY